MSYQSPKSNAAGGSDNTVTRPSSVFDAAVYWLAVSFSALTGRPVGPCVEMEKRMKKLDEANKAAKAEIAYLHEHGHLPPLSKATP